MSPEPGAGEGAAVEWIESLDLLGIRLGLERMRRLLAALGHPERLPAIHVVGTNGKSSTTRLAAAALAATGRRVGAYTSPHVVGWRERIEVDGHPVDGRAFGAAVARVRAAADGLGAGPDDAVTQFEALTAAAFVAFRDAGVEVCVVEAGLGGRYDASNVLPEGTVVALTNIALEHTDLLGDTEAQIAAEKLAVAPDGSDRLVLGRLEPSGRAAVEGVMGARDLRAWEHGRDHEAQAVERGVRVRTPHGVHAPVRMVLRGGFQRDNLSLAVAATERLLDGPLPEEAVAAAARVRVPGRMELVAGAPPVLIDGAHNPAGMRALAAALADALPGRPRIAVTSVLGDKDVGAMMSALAGRADLVIATRSTHRRAATPDAIVAACADAGVEARAVADPRRAVDAAAAAAGPSGGVVVCGSLYLLGDVRAHVRAAADPTPDTLARARDGASLTDEAEGP